MKRFYLILIPILLCSCSTTRNVQMQVAEHVQKDTVYLSNMHYDSIYVSQDKYTDRSRDTLLIKETNTVYKYKLLRDTVQRVKIETIRDSIPYEVRITEVKEVKYIPPWIKPLALIGFITILVLLIYTITKLKRF